MQPDQSLALLVFAVGAIVTVTTVAMVIRGHCAWRGREPWDEA
jgi:hypothetical protein